MDKNLRGYLAELIGTFALVFLTAATVCANQAAVLSSQAGPGVIGVAIVYGFIFAATLAVTLPVSEGYLNPAITLMLWVFKRLDGFKTTALILVQLLGAALAGGLVRLVFSEIVQVQARMGTPHVNLEAFDVSGITRGVQVSAVAMELGLTFVLTLVIYATLIDPRSPRWLGTWGTRLAPLWTGLALVAITLAGFNITGAAVNPARWFGTVIWEQTLAPLQAQRPFEDQVVYWLGPIVGALLAGLVYTMLIRPDEAEHPATSGVAVAAGKLPAGTGALSRAKK